MCLGPPVGTGSARPRAEPASRWPAAALAPVAGSPGGRGRPPGERGYRAVTDSAPAPSRSSVTLPPTAIAST